MKLYFAVQDLKEYSINDIKLLKQYYNIPEHINGDNLIWLIASNIHSGKMNMAPDKVWIKYNNKLVPLLPSNLIENETYKQLFLDADPDPKKKNLEWMVTSFISGGYNISELPQLKLAIIKFNKLREKGTFKDNLVDFGGLHGFIRNNKEFPALTDFLSKYLDIDEPEYKFNVIIDNSDLKIIQTLNELASCKYGANTKWCTAGENENKFKKYYKYGELYIIIPKNPSRKGEKYQLYIPSKFADKENKQSVPFSDEDEDVDDEYYNSIEITDELNNIIYMDDLISIYPYLENISLIKYTLLRLDGLKMSYEEYLKSNDNLIYDMKDGKYEFKDGTYWYLDGKSNKVEKNNGIKIWYLKNNFHRIGGPAIEKVNGDKWWYQKGRLHREDGPAIELSNGDKKWYKNGELHREDGPAIELLNGDKKWYLNGKLTREEKINDVKIWYKDGKRHREDGPAVEYSNGDKYWYLNDKIHRVGGPAVEYLNGDKEWLEYGIRDRADGPAIEKANGDKYWYRNGELHRSDGPAIEWKNGDNEWYKNGQLHRTDGPAVEKINGYKAWYKYNNLHRENGPAIEKIDGYKAWYKYGKRHREDGPAIEKTDGTNEWWINGEKIK
jgi:hypothetical protein